MRKLSTSLPNCILLLITSFWLVGCHAAAVGSTSIRVINASSVSDIAGYATGPGAPFAFGRNVAAGEASCFTNVAPGPLQFQIGSGIPGEDPDVITYATGEVTINGGGGTLVGYGTASDFGVGFLQHPNLTTGESSIQAFFTGSGSSFDLYAIASGGSASSTNLIGNVSSSHRGSSSVATFPAGTYEILITPANQPTVTLATIPSLVAISGRHYVVTIGDDPTAASAVRECDDSGPTTGVFVNAIPDGGAFSFSVGNISLSSGTGYGNSGTQGDLSSIADGEPHQIVLTRVQDQSTTNGTATLVGLRDYTFFAIGNVADQNLSVVIKSMPYGSSAEPGRWSPAVVDGISGTAVDVYLVPNGSNVGSSYLLGSPHFGDLIIASDQVTGSYRFIITPAGQPSVTLAQSVLFTPTSGLRKTGVLTENASGNASVVLINR